MYCEKNVESSKTFDKNYLENNIFKEDDGISLNVIFIISVRRFNNKYTL